MSAGGLLTSDGVAAFEHDDMGFGGGCGGGGGDASFEVDVAVEAGVGGGGSAACEDGRANDGPSNSSSLQGQNHASIATQDFVSAAAVALARHVAAFSPSAAQSRKNCEDSAGVPGTQVMTNRAAAALAEHLLSLHRDTLVVSKALTQHMLGRSVRPQHASPRISEAVFDGPPAPPCSPHASQAEADEAEVAAALARHLRSVQDAATLLNDASSCDSPGSHDTCTVARALASHALNTEPEASALLECHTMMVASVLAQQALGR